MTTNVEELLVKARDCELKSSETYDYFARTFSYDNRAQAFSKALSADEKEHGAFMSSMLCELTVEQKTAEADYSHWHPVVQLYDFLDSNRCNAIQSIQDAFACTERIENFEVTSIVHLLFQKFIPDDRRNEELHRHLQRHYKKLEEFKAG